MVSALLRHLGVRGVRGAGGLQADCCSMFHQALFYEHTCASLWLDVHQVSSDISVHVVGCVGNTMASVSASLAKCGNIGTRGRWVQVLAEPIQTIMCKYAVPDAYEKLKEFTRGQDVSAEKLRDFVEGLEGVPEDVKEDMKQWRPSTYIGIAPELAKTVGDYF